MTFAYDSSCSLFHSGLNCRLINFFMYLQGAVLRTVPFDAACFIFCILMNIFLLHQVMIVWDKIELFDIDKLTALQTSKCSGTDKLLS
jgi:hypothetical protein